MKFFLFLTTVFITYFPFQGAEPVRWVTPAGHDFGDIAHKEPASFDFIFQNTGTEPIVIDNVRTSCGCTVPNWDTAPILPDSLGVISVKYDARDTGYFYKKVKVYISGLRKAEKLYVEGFVLGGPSED